MKWAKTKKSGVRILIFILLLSLIEISDFKGDMPKLFATNTSNTIAQNVFQVDKDVVPAISQNTYNGELDQSVINNTYGLQDEKNGDKTVVREVKEKRTKNSKHFLLADGSYKAEISMGDIHYEDENGQLQDISTDLVDEGDLDLKNVPLSKEVATEAKLIAKDNKNKLENGQIDKTQTDFHALQVPFDVKLPKNFSKGYSISKNSNSMMFIPQNTNRTVSYAVYNNRIVYNEAWKSVDASLEVLDIGIKETILLKDSSAPTSFSFEVRGNLDQYFKNSDLKISPAWLKDANGTLRDVVQKISNKNNKTYVDLEADVSGLAYPVTIDPSVTIQSTGVTDSYVSRQTPTTNYSSSANIYTGYSSFNSSSTNYESYLKFNTSSIPNNVTISSANISIYYVGDASGTAFSINPDIISVYKINSTWTDTTLNWNNKPIENSTPEFQTGYSTRFSTTYNLDITNLLKYWINGSSPNYGVALNTPLGGSFASSEYSVSSKRPSLVVYYNLPTTPAVLTPISGETVDSNYNITWTPATDPINVQSSLRYNIQFSNTGSTWNDIVALTTPGVSSYSYNFLSASESTNAYVRIRAYNGLEYGPWGTSKSFNIKHNSAPNAPTNPNPGTVSSSSYTLITANPILNWTFSDLDTGDAQSAYNVIIYSGTNVYFDSGWINGSSSSYTIPTTANLVRGTVYNWKVATKDLKSAVSPQSTAMYIKVNTLPTTSVISYTDGQTVSDNILTFNWTYSDVDSQTQSAYQIQGSQNSFSTIAYDSGTITGAAASFTTPPLGSGSWSFRIRTYDGMEWSNWSNRNNLTLPNSFEPNDDTTHAFPILYNNTYSTLIGTASDVDYFKYTSTANGIDRIVLTPSTGKNYDVYVYDSSDNLVASSVRGVGFTENFIYEVTNGTTYYVKVMGVGGDYSATLPYSLTLSTLTSNYQTIYQFDNNGNITGKTITRIN